MDFKLHPNFNEKIFVKDLPLCSVFLEDNHFFPWLMLIPRRKDKSRIMDLNLPDQILLLNEIDLAQKALWQIFSPHQINVAAIGNKTPQLHIHVIARFENDPLWPQTVWDKDVKEKYSENEKGRVVSLIDSILISA
jgi:diadenosine tetraphosphate (Ap4A) HIT family hydrolase